jgi:hypothetical protein
MICWQLKGWRPQSSEKTTKSLPSEIFVIPAPYLPTALTRRLRPDTAEEARCALSRIEADDSCAGRILTDTACSAVTKARKYNSTGEYAWDRKTDETQYP